ncbi:hypothetical protein FGO68_gene14402 [Halteria grandinella]|uniref:Fibronectin type-III domain-containing protein n=1 Tax=Halteria grandinella TaxID=5974 RepID=A0A8J8NG00_HALGN|nr:hypothetical protein FGO68_gene14402 [Halteria grandinella]
MHSALAASSVSSLSASATCSGITFTWSGNMDYFCYQIKSKANVLSSCLQNSTSKSYFVSTNDLISLYGYYPTQAISWQVIGTDNGDQDNPVTSKTSSSLFYDVPWKNMSTPSQDYVSANSSQKIAWTVDTSPNDLDEGGGTAPIDGYVLELSSDGGTSYSNLATVSGISTNMWFRTIPGTTFAYNTAYKVRVTPKNSCGQGRWFSPVLSWTSVGLPPQIAPTGLTNTLNDGTSLSWTWNAIPDTNNATGGFPITGYKLQWASLNGSCWSGSWCTVVDNLNALTYTQTNQADNEIYNFRVFGINSKGDSTFYSDNVTVATPMVPPYIAPPTLGWQNCSHVRIVWTEPNFYNRGRLPVTNQISISMSPTQPYPCLATPSSTSR